MYHFCTYFDRNYLSRGLALHQSLQRHCPESILWVLCMDTAVHQILLDLSLPSLNPISLEVFELGDAPLHAAKQNRSRVEYYFTCTPSLPLYVFNHSTDVDLVTYIDADLFFFSDPTPLFEELAGSSVAIIGHRFPPHLRHLETHGIYNVGWLSFRRDENGLACLRWWRDRCIEWCYDRLEGNRYGDQKYLDDWPQRFRGVRVLDHKGANLAPWNVTNYSLRFEAGQILVDEQPLLFFHFHGLKEVFPYVFDTNLKPYGGGSIPLLKPLVYRPYLRELYSTYKVIPTGVTLPISTGLRDQKSRTETHPLGSRIWGHVLRVNNVIKQVVNGCYLVHIARSH